MLLLDGFLFADKSGFRVHLKWPPLLHDFRRIGSLSRGWTVLAVLYYNLCRAANSKVKDIARCLAGVSLAKVM